MRTLDDHTNVLASFLPEGEAFNSKRITTSTMYKLVRTIAGEFQRMDEYVNQIKNELLPVDAYAFLDQIEEDLGIPDDCFPGTGTIEERRAHVLIKIASLGVQTVADFEGLAALFGVSASVEPGIAGAVFPYTFPIVFLSKQDARFTIRVTFNSTVQNEFPLTFPFVFGDPIIGILQCLFTKLKPANCAITFLEVE